MKIHDISVSLKEGSFVFPGDPEMRVSRFLSKEKGDLANVSLISLGTHSGTHVDPPLHLWDGGPGVDNLPLDVLIGEATVIELDVPQKITADALIKVVRDRSIERILIKTRNSTLWTKSQFVEDFVYLAPDGAEWLAKSKVRLAGFDYLSLEKYDSTSLASHKALLGEGVVVVEGLDLSGVQPGDYTLVCLPLKIANGDGGLARAVLIEK